MDHRQGFLVSFLVHLTILTLIVSGKPEETETEVPEEDPAIQTSRVFMPPPELLRQMAPPPAPPPGAPPPPPPAPAPTPAPTPADGRDRISVGAPSTVREEGPLILRRDQDLTEVPEGRPDAVEAPEATPPPTPAPVPESVRRAQGPSRDEVEGRPGLRLPPAGPLAGGDDGTRETEGEAGALTSALRRLEREGPGGKLGLPEGTGRQIGALLFDPKGADFTAWINHFKNEVYKNWLIPQGAFLGLGGEVKIQFVVVRDGTMTQLRLIQSSGVPANDKAARGALLGSLLLPLPSDYGPPEVTFVVTFFYGRG